MIKIDELFFSKVVFQHSAEERSCAVRTVGGGVAGVVLRLRVWDVHEPLVAHVAFTAAEENLGAHLPLHTLVAAEDIEVGIRNTHTELSISVRRGTFIIQSASNIKDVTLCKKHEHTLLSLLFIPSQPQRTMKHNIY